MLVLCIRRGVTLQARHCSVFGWCTRNGLNSLSMEWDWRDFRKDPTHPHSSNIPAISQRASAALHWWAGTRPPPFMQLISLANEHQCYKIPTQVKAPHSIVSQRTRARTSIAKLCFLMVRCCIYRIHSVLFWGYLVIVFYRILTRRVAALMVSLQPKVSMFLMGATGFPWVAPRSADGVWLEQSRLGWWWVWWVRRVLWLLYKALRHRTITPSKKPHKNRTISHPYTLYTWHRTTALLNHRIQRPNGSRHYPWSHLPSS